jgi:hypothetical protein
LRIIPKKRGGISKGHQLLCTESICAVDARGYVFACIDGFSGMSLLPFEITTLGHHRYRGTNKTCFALFSISFVSSSTVPNFIT